MKHFGRRAISALMIIIMAAGIISPLCVKKRAEAAAAHVSLSNLGTVGTLSVGSKTKRGSWWKLYLNGCEMFCLNLGQTCHAGDAYQSESDWYSSTDTGKKGLEACIGYWFDKIKNRNNKAYIFAQALFWAVEEGERSKSALTEVIRTMQKNTGYYSGQTAGELYQQIFQPEGTVRIHISLWKYTGEGQKRQILLDVTATSIQKPRPKRLHSTDVYRQRITLSKTDEFGKPLAGVTFRLAAENVDELYYFKAKGLGDEDAGEVDEDADNFELEMKTDERGRIAYRFNYHVQSRDYYYFTAAELEQMSAEEKRKAVQELDEEGLLFGKSLTYQEAEELSEKDIQEQIRDIKNRYQIQEISTGDDNLYSDSEAIKIVLGGENSWQQLEGRWPEEITGLFENYPQAYQMNLSNRYKKVRVKVLKKDAVSGDGRAHGDASLDGAQFQLYDDRACTKPAKVFDRQGNQQTAGVYTVVNEKLKTDYIQCGKTYYLKEIRAPRGYKITEEVLEIRADGTEYRAEYTEDAKTYSVNETPIRGRISLNKYSTDGTTGPIISEEGAQFQVYLKSAGSYGQADEYERDLITTDREGYACTKDLYYGVYKVHQISSGSLDTELVNDFEVVIDRELIGKTYHSVVNNKPFRAFLRVVKKDGNTQKEVLKAGTTYQIYQVDSRTGKESLVKQTFSNGNQTQVVDRFQSDATGRIMTVDSLTSGTYRIYETEAVSGLHISQKYIEVVINSKAGNYTLEKDSEGNEYTTVTMDYVNNETYGKLSILKRGQQLEGFENGQFQYKDAFLKGVVFEIYAAEDIVTQDNQKTNWFDKDALVAAVTTGVGAEFKSECGGITGYERDENGTVTINLPLGRYRVIEKQTVYGYILPEKKSWDVEFTWKNKDETYVLNSTEDTDQNGVMQIRNRRARSAVSLIKVDREEESPIGGAVFDLYSSNPIYNADGDRIVDADTLLGTVETDREGTAEFDLDLPLMSREFNTEGDSGKGFNSGDYYIQERMVSDSYYISGEKYPVHLEYKDQETPVIARELSVRNTQTTVEISKVSATGSGEILGCQLQITDGGGNVMVSWTSGDAASVRLDERSRERGYENLRTRMDEKGNLLIGGLFHDKEYTLTETRPADGYVTADPVVFRLTGRKTADGQVTQADIRAADGTFLPGSENRVIMIDEQTHVKFCKLAGDRAGYLAGAQIMVLDPEGNEITSFVTKEDTAVELNGILAAGTTYIFREIKAPEGYKKSADIRFTVQDTPEIQGVEMTDMRMETVKLKEVPKGSAMTVISKKKTPKSRMPEAKKFVPQPETGFRDGHVLVLAVFAAAGISAAVIGTVRYRRRRSLSVQRESQDAF